tara:strand:+ start:1469 stop:2473 length:1005 start_codon:yes stop_codon:yes gene_type:complete
MLLKRISIVVCFIFVVLAVSLSHAQNFVEREEVRAYLDELSGSYGFSRNNLEKILSDHKPNKRIIDLISRPSEKRLQWHEYRKILVDEARIKLGVEFWNENIVALSEAEQVYSVVPEIIVAIIGVETRYGKIMGSYPVVEALSTLAFDYPPRAKFFRKELTEFFILTRDQKLDPASLTGSYAGAMGYGQFIPSSYRAYAVDFDGDNFKDIWNNKADAIGSVANYFSRHGWQGDGPVIVRGYKTSHNLDVTANESLEPKLLAGDLRKKGIRNNLADNTKVALFEMQGERGQEYWLGLSDFYVITRYNRSSMYALAVFQLSQAIKQERIDLLNSLN